MRTTMGQNMHHRCRMFFVTQTNRRIALAARRAAGPRLRSVAHLGPYAFYQLIKVLGIPLLLVSCQFVPCDAPLGTYELVTESHWGAKLVLESRTSFVLTWWAYPAGEPEAMEAESYTGSWHCHEDLLTFKHDNEESTANYRNPDYSPPLGIPWEGKALVFNGEHERGKLLRGWTYWLSSISK